MLQLLVKMDSSRSAALDEGKRQSSQELDQLITEATEAAEAI